MTDEEHDMSNTPTVRAHANLRLPHSDRAPRLARAFVAENLQGWQLDDLVETASLVVSEVVTNAVIHARSDAELVLERTPTALRISVIDHGERAVASARRPAGATAAGAFSSSKRCRRAGEPSQRKMAIACGPSSRSSRPDLEHGTWEGTVEANPEELTIRHHVDGDALVVEVSGEIDLHTASELQRTVDRLSPFPHPVVLDLGGVGFIDSTGIRALLGDQQPRDRDDRRAGDDHERDRWHATAARADRHRQDHDARRPDRRLRERARRALRVRPVGPLAHVPLVVDDRAVVEDVFDERHERGTQRSR